MKILAIETSGRDVAAAVTDETGPIASGSVRSRRRHAELLHPLMSQVCEQAGIPLAGLDAVAVDVGPGLFTGIRVGVAAAKGLATALGIPVVSLTSLDILRAACESAGRGHLVAVPVVDLRRGEIAWSLPGEVVDFGTPEQLAGLLPTVGGPLVLVGDGALRYASVLSPEQATAVAGVELASPPVASLAVLAVEELRAGRVIDPIVVLPVYLREADARINWTTRHDAPGLVVPEVGAR